MQQPDYRDQSEPEKTEESIQSDSSKVQNQEMAPLEQEEKEADDELVSWHGDKPKHSLYRDFSPDLTADSWRNVSATWPGNLTGAWSRC